MINSFYPVLMTKNIDEEAEFFKSIFNFTETFSADWYISMQLADKFELAIIDSTHDTIPETFRNQVQGLLLNFEVDDANKWYTEINDKYSSCVVQEIRDEEFGQRHFIIETPSKVLVDIIEVIPPTEEFLAQYND